jgi:hypothetical protein
MSELSVILTPDDKLEFAEWLVENYSARFVVDDDQPQITDITVASDLHDTLVGDTPPLVFVLSEQWTSLPLYKRAVENVHKGEIHYVQQRCGGPAFTWMPGNFLRDHTKPALSAGLFGDYPFSYTKPGSSETIDRPECMADAYNAARTWIRRMCGGKRTVYRKSKRSGPWISERSLDLIRSGLASLANDELDLPPISP